MPNVLVYAESRGGELRKVALEAVTAARPAGRIIGEGAAAVPELVRLLQNEAKVI